MWWTTNSSWAADNAFNAVDTAWMLTSTALVFFYDFAKFSIVLWWFSAF